MSRREPEPRRIDIAPGYVPHTAQRVAHQSRHRFKILSAGVRGGKTKDGAVQYINSIYRDVAAGRVNALPNEVNVGGKRRRPRYHSWVVAPTIPLTREAMRAVFDVVPKPLVERWFEGESALWLHPDILIEFKGAENEKSLVSVGLQSMWIDEAARVKALSWRSALRSRLTDHNGWCLFTTSPMGQGNWVFTDLIAKGTRIRLTDKPDGRMVPVQTQGRGFHGFDPDVLTVEWTTAQNPFIPRKDIEAAQRQLPWRFFKRDYLASWDSMTGNIFEEFDPAIHVFQKQPSAGHFQRIIGLMDFGWVNPGCLLMLGDLGGKFMVVDEVYGSYRTFCDERMEEKAGPVVVDKPRPTWVGEAKRMVAKWAGHQRSCQFFCDPAEPDKIHDLKRFGIYASEADNDVLYGIRRVAEALHPVDGVPALKIWAGCKNLLRELPLYEYAQDRNGASTEYPVKKNDHAIDPLRYGVVEVMKYADMLARRANDPDGPIVQPIRDYNATNRDRALLRRGMA